jgi:hypothetical protein
MHKYAAPTALAIALITMLALAVLASLTAANAANGFCSNGPVGRIYCPCFRQCQRDAVHDHAPLSTIFDDKKYRTCLSKCVNAAEATRR